MVYTSSLVYLHISLATYRQGLWVSTTHLGALISCHKVHNQTGTLCVSMGMWINQPCDDTMWLFRFSSKLPECYCEFSFLNQTANLASVKCFSQSSLWLWNAARTVFFYYKYPLFYSYYNYCISIKMGKWKPYSVMHVISFSFLFSLHSYNNALLFLFFW